MTRTDRTAEEVVAAYIAAPAPSGDGASDVYREDLFEYLDHLVGTLVQQAGQGGFPSEGAEDLKQIVLTRLWLICSQKDRLARIGKFDQYVRTVVANAARELVRSNPFRAVRRGVRAVLRAHPDLREWSVDGDRRSVLIGGRAEWQRQDLAPVSLHPNLASLSDAVARLRLKWWTPEGKLKPSDVARAVVAIIDLMSAPAPVHEIATVILRAGNLDPSTAQLEAETDPEDPEAERDFASCQEAIAARLDWMMSNLTVSQRRAQLLGGSDARSDLVRPIVLGVLAEATLVRVLELEAMPRKEFRRLLMRVPLTAAEFAALGVTHAAKRRAEAAARWPFGPLSWRRERTRSQRD